MDLEQLREYCLSFEGVTEKTPFGKFAKRYDSILVFYVCDHMFCFVDMEDFSYVDLRLTPESINEIREKYQSIGNPINQSLKYWIQLNFNGDIPDTEITRLIVCAYDTVKQKYTPKPR